MMTIDEAPDEVTKRNAVLRIGERELDERAEVRIEVADVEAAFVGPQAHAVDAAAGADHLANRVGQLDLAGLARPRALEDVEDRRRQHVPRGDGEAARRLVLARL